MSSSQRRIDAPIFVVADWTPPAAICPFKTWKDMKDFAREVLQPNSDPRDTEVSMPSATGRTAGFVVCRTRKDAERVYDKLEKDAGRPRLHLFDMKDGSHHMGLVDCNCPGGHNYGSTYYSVGYQHYFSNKFPLAIYATPDPTHYPQPYARGQAPGHADPVSQLSSGMSNLGMNSTPYPGPTAVQYPTQGSAGYMPGYNVSYQPSYSNPPQPSSYAGYPVAQYPSAYGSTNQYNMAPHTGAYDAYGGNAQGQSGYQYYDGTAYNHTLSSTATQGYEYEEAAQSSSSTIPGGYVRVEPIELILSNLDPKTSENDIRKEVDKIVQAVRVKLNKYEHHPKRNITAVVTFNRYGDMKKVKEQFEKKPRHIKGRIVAVRVGKGSIKVENSGPVVVTSDPPA